MSSEKQPIFNAPAIVIVFIAIFVLLHAVHWINAPAARMITLGFGFFSFEEFLYKGVLTPLPASLTYAFLHNDNAHLIINSLMFLSFATPIAKRMSWTNFIIFMLIMAFAGAVAHLMTNYHEKGVLIGASAITSGLFAACMRLPFMGTGNAALLPPIPLTEMLTSKQHILTILIWLGINYLFGAGKIMETGGAEIAWEAHIGGFIIGFFLLNLFDKKTA